MNRDSLAKLLTLLLAAGALAGIAWKNGLLKMPDAAPSTATGGSAVRTAPGEESPEDALYAAFDAARNGDIRAYLDRYTGEMAAALQRTVTEQGESQFAEYLKKTNAPIKGIAINAPAMLTDREAKARVEFVYQDRNEVQTFILEKSGKSWKISRQERAEAVKTLVPYGTPVR